jgi:mRNA interferase MazF
MAIRRGEVFFVDLNPVRGREQAGRRPVLVVSDDAINAQPLVVTVVVGTNAENIRRDYPTNVRVAAADSGLPMDTVFLCFQIRALDRSRFDTLVGRLPAGQMARVDEALRRSLSL